jgi:hypothetical protein
MGVGAGWYYDSADGDVVHQNLAESLANVLGPYFHGPYATEAEAIAHKGVAGAPGVPNEGVSQQLGTAVSSGLGGLLPKFTSQQWREFAIRGLKVIGGLVLIVVGLAQLVRVPKVVPLPV